MPVINASWGDAKHYVAWLSQLTGKVYRANGRISMAAGWRAKLSRRPRRFLA
jgi:formylglycine-generating enzyme required for sulfatase activity